MAPFYDYSCKKCDFVFELMHSFKEKPQPPCPKCGSKNTFKMISLCGIIIHNNSKCKMNDAKKKEADKKEELRQMGIEKITPMNGVSIDQVYSEVKKQGSAVKEQMHSKRESDQAKKKIKDREWKIAALKRTPERAKIRKEMKTIEEFKKRAIRI